VLRTGESVDEERAVLALLDRGVAVHPGFFFDFERNGHLAVSLLPPPDRFAEGATRLPAALAAW
jgi:aspartate/methionine/tyrosine aminotransferase